MSRSSEPVACKFLSDHKILIIIKQDLASLGAELRSRGGNLLFRSTVLATGSSS